MLNELWNRDKHRIVTFVAQHITFRGIGGIVARTTAAESADFVAQVISAEPVGPVEDGAHIALIRLAPATAPDHHLRNVPVEMEIKITYHVAFENGPPAYGGLVFETLDGLRDLVTAILIDFEPELR